MKNIFTKKILRKVLVNLFVFSIIVLVPVFVMAQNQTAPGGNQTAPGGNQTASGDKTIHIGIDNPLGEENKDLMSLITLILQNIVMPVAAVAVVLWILWAGFTFLTAQGKPAEVEKAKSRIMWSLIGAGILLGAQAIASVLKATIEQLKN